MPAPVWHTLADRVLTGGAPVTRDEALAILRAPDEELPSILDAAFRVRRAFHGLVVRLHLLENAKSGGCPEDCHYCAQAARYSTPAEQYPLEAIEEIVAGARRAREARAVKYCIVTATRSPSQRDLDVVCEAVRRIKAEHPGLKVCASLGLLTPEKAARLAEAGVDRVNHNLETSERYFAKITSTHGFTDRVETVRVARAAGMEICCGGIVGMGETDEDVVDLALALREVGADSIPVNFHDPRPGTPLAALPRPRPTWCLKALAMFRLVHPRADVRAAGGREANLRALQPLALYAATSIFTSGYLTTGGAEPSADHRMIADLGFEIAAD